MPMAHRLVPIPTTPDPIPPHRQAATAEVEVRSVFAVKGRGAVVIAYPRQGTVRVGQETQWPAQAGDAIAGLTVAAAEVVRSPDGGADAVGLVFHQRPPLEQLRLALPPGTRLRFQEAPDTDVAEVTGS
jgi:hypothetical protein